MAPDAPWLEVDKRRTVRSPVNPLDKSTVVSIYPKEINETKHTIQPGKFHIDKGSFEKPALLVVGPSSWWRDLDPGQPLLEIPVSSIQIANSIIVDFCNGLVGCDMAASMPGIFWVEGAKTVDQIKKEHGDKLTAAYQRQKMWYQTLVRMADTLWSRSNGNPLSISDDMRIAALELNLKEKPWIKDYSTIQLINCKACGHMCKPGFPVCPNCHHVVDETLYKELKLQKAG